MAASTFSSEVKWVLAHDGRCLSFPCADFLVVHDVSQQGHECRRSHCSSVIDNSGESFCFASPADFGFMARFGLGGEDRLVDFCESAVVEYARTVEGPPLLPVYAKRATSSARNGGGDAVREMTGLAGGEEDEVAHITKVAGEV